MSFRGRESTLCCFATALFAFFADLTACFESFLSFFAAFRTLGSRGTGFEKMIRRLTSRGNLPRSDGPSYSYTRQTYKQTDTDTLPHPPQKNTLYGELEGATVHLLLDSKRHLLLLRSCSGCGLRCGRSPLSQPQLCLSRLSRARPIHRRHIPGDPVCTVRGTVLQPNA